MPTTQFPKVLADYQNGNTYVRLYDNGTKDRSWAYNEQPKSAFPDSIDIKITDYCDAGCDFCHESSTVKGRHAKPEVIYDILSDIPEKIELAIGGGDSLSHPQFEEILRELSKRFVCNVTVNSQHIARSRDRILRYWADNLIYGLGISVSGPIDFESEIYDVLTHKTVLHVISGLAHPNDVIQWYENIHDKILVLGYKNYGRGVSCGQANNTLIDNNLSAWRYFLPQVIRHFNLAFDNLAIEQLRVRDQVDSYDYERFYQGPDGSHSMYVNAVNDTFALSSTKARIKRNKRSILECFNVISQPDATDELIQIKEP